MDSMSRVEQQGRFYAFILVGMVTLILIAAGMTVPLLSLMLAQTVMRLMRQSALGQWQGRKALGVFLLLLVALCMALLFTAAVNAVLGSSARMEELLVRVGSILQSLRLRLPGSLADYLPQQQDLLGMIAKGVSQHATELSALGLGTLKHMGYLLIGLLIGILMSLDHDGFESKVGPRTRRLWQQCHELRMSFARIAAAQVRISLINTMLTLIYLLIALPLAGIHLPFSKTLVLLTFLGGLIPILGNLISNTVILVLSLGISLPLAGVSLLFLVLVHKFEYFINARIMGSSIHARAWEMLLSMILLERFLGLSGVVMAPILYAWLKQEWMAWDTHGITNDDCGAESAELPAWELRSQDKACNEDNP